jgi:hypothetical protein
MALFHGVHFLELRQIDQIDLNRSDSEQDIITNKEQTPVMPALSPRTNSSYAISMSHHTARESYRKLSERINRFPQGAPPTELLFQILEVLFTPAEAELVALLPIKPFTAETAALLWKKSETEARNILEALASRGMMLDIDSRHGQMFAMPPPMAGFFEFSMMRIGDQSRRDGVAHRHRHLLLPPQGVASGAQLRSADGHLYDLQLHCELAD